MGSQSMSVFASTMAVGLGVLMMVTIISFGYYLCNRIPPYPPRRLRATPIGDSSAVLHLDPEVRYPMMLYSQAKRKSRGTITCSICLAEYNDSDVLRLLPLCDHLFHRNCIDSWLRLRSSCPLCRTAPAPPLTVVVDSAPATLV